MPFLTKILLIILFFVSLRAETIDQTSVPEFIPDEKLGFRINPEKKIKHLKKIDGKTIYDVSYSFDEFGRRIAANHHPLTNEFLVFLGCSFVYGNGLNDDQTLNWFFNKQSSRYAVHNYGVGGTGTNYVLALMESGRLKKEIDQKSGVFVYLMIDGHVPRANGHLPSLKWGKRTPFYDWKGERLVRKGSFETGRAWISKLLLGVDSLFGRFSIIKNRILPTLELKHYQKVCQMISQAKEKAVQDFPGSRFLVYLHPLSVHKKELVQCLVDKGIDYLPSQLKDSDDLRIPGDGHPNQLANQKIALEILNYISQ